LSSDRRLHERRLIEEILGERYERHSPAGAPER
jgi:hypothetical protein